MDLQLMGRRALVTGGSRGIGKAAAAGPCPGQCGGIEQTGGAPGQRQALVRLERPVARGDGGQPGQDR